MNQYFEISSEYLSTKLSCRVEYSPEKRMHLFGRCAIPPGVYSHNWHLGSLLYHFDKVKLQGRRFCLNLYQKRTNLSANFTFLKISRLNRESALSILNNLPCIFSPFSKFPSFSNTNCWILKCMLLLSLRLLPRLPDKSRCFFIPLIIVGRKIDTFKAYHFCSHFV